jgi:hypothetical protein
LGVESLEKRLNQKEKRHISIFSARDEYKNNIKRKVITIFGVKAKFKVKVKNNML